MRRSTRLRLATVLTTALSAATLLTGAPAAVANGTELTGLLRLPTGAPACGADVYLSPLRSTADDAEQQPLVHAVADARGAFRIAVPVTSDVTELAKSNGGFVNFELMAAATDTCATPSELGPYAQGQVAAAEATLYEIAHSFAASYLETIDGAVSSGLAFLSNIELTLQEAANGTISPPPANGAVEHPGDSEAPLAARGTHLDGCYFTGWKKVDGPHGRSTVIGELHTYQDMSATFAYATSANTSIGVAYSADGKPWRVNGRVHIANSDSSSNSGVQVGSYWGREINATFNYVKEKNEYWCYWWRQFVQHRVRATVWNGDVFPGADRSYMDGYYTYKDARDDGSARIAKLVAGQKFERVKEKTHDYSAAATAFGATLNAQTGFNSTHRLTVIAGWDVYWHYLIGNDNPPTKAGIIYAY